jgi:hypothetical protein
MRMTELEEQRRAKREQTIFYLEVIDAEIDQSIGRLVDLTTDGIMVVHDSPLAVHREYQLRILLPRELNGASQIEFKAECRWCRLSVNQDYFDAGLRIVEVSANERLRMEMVMKYYSFPHNF